MSTEPQKKQVVFTKHPCENMTVCRPSSSTRELRHSLGALRHSMLCKLPRQDQAHSSLNL
eukprot:c24002_g1_i1 orf=2-178(-)